MTRTDDLILFAQVVEFGSFSKVAEHNNLSNSVVSKRIARLEEELSIQLLYRTTRKLTLTEAGKVLYQGARNVKSAAAEALNAVSGYGVDISGHIKMSVPTISGDLLLADAVSEFCSMHPGMSVDMSLDNRFVDLISEGFDLVIRTGYLDDSSLISRHIVDSHWVVCSTKAMMNKLPANFSPSDLIEHNCLLYTYQTNGSRDWGFLDDGKEYIVTVSGNFTTDNASALRKAAMAGRGFIYVPRCLVYLDLLSGDLVDVFPNKVSKKLGVYAIYPFTRQQPAKIKLLIEHIRQRYLDKKTYF
ncbi:MAG: LysR family transcriptional regulator [Aliivibrio sp.]|uniref:LysR family transcriptional regulator n=1 Tax=Aliivibrio sp. TaxID=1872443 RepID=UPI001A59DB20|nr:LysR family transcriptional regulator [Aliivibrio sp.]